MVAEAEPSDVKDSEEPIKLPEEAKEEDREARPEGELEADPYFFSQFEQSLVEPSLVALDDSKLSGASPGPVTLQKHGAGGGLLHLH